MMPTLTRPSLFFSPLPFLIAGLATAAWTDSAAAAEPVPTAAALREAVRAAAPGDTIVVADGVWRDERIILEADGREDAPVTIRPQTPGGLALTGQSSLEARGSFLVIEGLHFRDGWLDRGHVVHLRGTGHVLRGTAIDGYNPPDRETRYFWVSLTGDRHLVENSVFRNMDHSGVTVVVWRSDDSPDHHVIRRNHFLDRPQGTANGWEMIRIGTSHQSLSDSHSLVEENLFERCDGEIEVISNKSGRNRYRRNTFRASRGTLTLRHGNHCVVEENFFLGEDRNGTGGIRVIGEGHRVVNNYIEETRGRGGAAIALSTGVPDGPLHGYYAADRALIAHNTIIGVTGPHLHLTAGDQSGRDIPARGVILANNLLAAGGAGGGPLVAGRAGPDLRAAGNLGHGRPAGAVDGDGLRMADPLLERGEDGLYRPRPGSPAAGGGEPGLLDLRRDIGGRDRRADEPTVGCWEVSDDPLRHRPLEPEDVGPSWNWRD